MDISEKIDAAYVAQQSDKPRSYIGASIIGNQCTAYLAFCLRGFPETPPPPNLKRIFALGHKLEAMVIADLKKAGLIVDEVDPLTGKQWEWQTLGGHISSHADGIVEIDGMSNLLEIKSMNDASWAKFKSSGVRVSHRHYYDQMQFMLGKSGLRKCLFIAYNKNNSKYHNEFVEFDPMEFHGLMGKAHLAMNEPTKISVDETDWRCRGCFKSEVCWAGKEAEKACRTCQHSMPYDKGGWWCMLNKDRATTTCDNWKQFAPKDKP